MEKLAGDALSFFESVRAQAVQAGQTVGDELSKGVNWSKLQEDIANIPAELARVPAELAREARQEPSLLSQSRGFKEFKSLYQLQSVSLDPESEDVFRYYDGGPRKGEVLLCLPGASGTAEIFYKQMLILCPKGYRVVTVQFPPYYTHDDWLAGLDAFVAHLKLDTMHLLGVSLGGFLAQLYAERRPHKVASLVLCNSFISTRLFADNAVFSSAFQFMPAFYLKDYMLESFPSCELDTECANAVDFVLEQLDTLSQEDLASRLSLNCHAADCGTLHLSGSQITIIDSLDRTARPHCMRDQLHERYADARQGLLRTGGDFPFLSRCEETAVFIQVHLRSNAVRDAGMAEGTGGAAPAGSVRDAEGTGSLASTASGNVRVSETHDRRLSDSDDMI